MRAKYWSNSKLSAYLRAKVGITSPTALEWSGWKKWRADYKAKNKVMYFITEDLLDSIQDVINYIPDNLYSMKYYLRNRFVTKTHYLNTGLEVGHWHDLDDRILHGLFNELVDFVEIEKAWMFVVFDNKAFDKYNFPKSLKNRFLKWKEFRCAEAGIAHLNWEITLEGDDTNQASTAKELLFLYDWWKNIRPDRPDPYEVSGYNSLKADLDYVRPEVYEMLKKADLIERKYHDEDTEMLCSLVKLRGSLWT